MIRQKIKLKTYRIEKHPVGNSAALLTLVMDPYEVKKLIDISPFLEPRRGEDTIRLVIDLPLFEEQYIMRHKNTN